MTNYSFTACKTIEQISSKRNKDNWDIILKVKLSLMRDEVNWKRIACNDDIWISNFSVRSRSQDSVVRLLVGVDILQVCRHSTIILNEDYDLFYHMQGLTKRFLDNCIFVRMGLYVHIVYWMFVIKFQIKLEWFWMFSLKLN